MTDENNPSKESESNTLTKEKTQPPRMWKVILHNDDYTTMEFVIHVLMKFFNKNSDQAHALMLKVHHEDLAIVGVFTHEIAESKTAKVNNYSKSKGHPLKCSMEPCEDEN